MKTITIKKNICKVCGIRGIYNTPSETYGIYCKVHKDDSMISVVNRKCKYDKCYSQAVFNYKCERYGLYCGKHKLENMVDIKNKRCIFENCESQPNFGYDIPLYCSKHKLENMTNIKGRKCKIEYCEKYPTFNYKDEKYPLYCVEHKSKDMVDIKSKKCMFDNCQTIPTFNYKNITKPIYCIEHKLENMVDVKHSLCTYKDCISRPSFNYKGCNKPIYCSIHKIENMVNVISNYCSYENCETIAFYGYCGQSPTRCSKNIEKNMFIKPKRRCLYENCKNISLFGIKEPSHCEDHLEDNEISLISAECKECKRKDELLNKEGICINYCAPNQLYNKHKMREKTKEILMLDFIDKNVKLKNNISVKDDKIVDSYCNMYRPDRIYDCGTHMLIIECDENQHKNKYFCSSYKDLKHSEICRMQEIQNASGMSCIFLRWNPDNLKIKDKICRKYSLDKRLNTLKYWIEQCSEMIPSSYIEPVKYKYLFYDDYKEEDLGFNIITENNCIFLT